MASISGAAPATFTYDSRGNVATKNNMSLLFDQKNQLTQISGVGNYAYDAAGRRVSKVAGGATTYYFYNQAGQLMYQREPHLAKSTNYLYLGTKLVARNASIHLDASAAIGFDANPNNGTYTVSWVAVAGATSYVLEESANGGAWATVFNGSATSAALTGRPGGSYVYRVAGCISSTCSTFTTSGTLGVKPTLPAVSVPAGIVNGTYTVSWSSPRTASSYTVQERLNDGTWTTVAQGTAANSVSRPGTATGSYTYRVAADNAYGTRGWAESAAVTVNTAYGVMPNPVPGYSVPAANSTGSVTLSWSASTPVTQYTLQQSSNGGSSWSTVSAGLGTTVTLSGLADGSYTYRLKACNDTAGNSVCTAWIAAGPMVVTHPPTTAPSLSAPANSANGGYTVSWGGVGGSATYTLQESVNSGGWSTVQANSNTSWSTNGRGNGKYGYRAQACNAGGCGPWSSTVSVTVLLPPSAPSTINVPATSNGPVALSWSSSATATSYTLQHAEYGVTGWSAIYTGSATAYTRQETVTGVWIYQVRACNASGCSAFRVGSGRVTVTIPPASAPSLTVPASSTTGSYTVSWGTVGGATSYTLQERINGGAWATVQAGSATHKAFSGKSNGTYGYRVQACNAGGCGPWSAIKNAVVTLIPATPTGLKATLKVIDLSQPQGATEALASQLPSFTYRLSASWNASANATSYTLKYCQNGGTCNTQTVTTTSASPLDIHGSSYALYVRACSASGCSAYSAEVAPTVIYE